MNKRVPPKLKKLSTVKQRRMDNLLEKNREGTITPDERVDLQQLVSEAEQIMVVNAERLAEFSSQSGLIYPRTPMGEATIHALDMNGGNRSFARKLQIRAGLLA